MKPPNTNKRGSGVRLAGKDPWGKNENDPSQKILIRIKSPGEA